jgi:rare lipoprotein A
LARLLKLNPHLTGIVLGSLPVLAGVAIVLLLTPPKVILAAPVADSAVLPVRMTAPAVVAPVALKPVVAAKPKPLATGLTGVASWYGSVLDGHRTASGERFNMNEMTAAHRTLPFGTMVRVLDLATGRSVVVRITDRGVLAPDRVIDLSSGAAKELGILSAGLAKVRLEVLKPAETVATP